MELMFDKVVLLSGTSGVGIGDMLERARDLHGDNAAYASFEDYVKNIGKKGIYTIASNLLWTPESALDVYNRAFRAMLRDLEDQKRRGAKIAFIETHVSYLSVHTLIPNPILHKMLRLGREATVLYYADDFYHALLRMARWVKEAYHFAMSEGFVIDPLSYLMWRGLDHSILIMLRGQYQNLETLLVGMKHPDATHNRILAYSALPSHRARMEYLLAYMSHPISGVRSDFLRLRESGELESIADHPFVKNFEQFKRRLWSRCRNLILFEPTSIDEILGPHDVENGYVVTKQNRWPHGRAHDYENMYPVDIFDEDTFGALYGGALTYEEVEPLEIKTASILDYRGEARQFYLNRMLRIISDHIEVRDYEYVGQSSAVIVYEPIYKSIVTGEETPSKGVRKEINRAESQAKAIYVVASGEMVSRVASMASGIFGERITPIKLSSPDDPRELLEILSEAGFC